MATRPRRFDAKGPRLLRITDIQNGKVDWASVPSCIIDADDAAKYSLRAGDIVFARTGATTGKSFLIRSCPPAVFASYLIRVRSHSLIAPAFLRAYFNTPDYWSFIMDNVAGNAQPNCNASKLGALRVPVAPAIEQERLVDKVQQLERRTDLARERLAKVPKILKAFRQSVLAAACSGRLTEGWRDSHHAPQWDKAVLKNLIVGRPRNGLSVKAVNYETNIRSLTLTATTSGRFEPGHFKYLDVDVPTDSHLWLKRGDILLQRGNTEEYVGVAAVYEGAEKKYIYPDLMIKIHPKKGVLSNYLWMALSAPEARQYFRNNATGSQGSMPKINQTIVEDALIPLPSTDEQYEIVRCVQALFGLAEKIEERVAAATNRAETLTQVVLAKAFRGELVPTEAELARREGRSYEAAAVLLERVRSERSKAVGSRRQQKSVR